MPGQIDELTHTTPLGTWRLTRAQPCAALVGIVHEYWEVQGRLSPFREALLPNGSGLQRRRDRAVIRTRLSSQSYCRSYTRMLSGLL